MAAIRDKVNPDRAVMTAVWHTHWWIADYSWDGLAAKAHDGVSLRDLWADEAAHLIAEPGTSRRWTRLHCPLTFFDGSASPKAAWSDADWEALRREYDSGDARVFDGAVWAPDLDISQVLSARNASIDGVVRLGDGTRIDLTGARIGGLSAAGGSVFEALICDEATIVGPVNLSDVAVSGVNSFRATTFLGDCLFTRARLGGTQSDFESARFAGTADFSEATFGGHAVFNKACFGGAVDFFGVRFINRALFDNAQCLEDIGFYKAAFVRRLSLNDAVFYGKVNLEGITDGDPIAQSPQAINLTVNTHEETPGLTGTLDASAGPPESGFRSLPKILSRRAVFYEDANFSNRDLLSPSTFERARFHNRARFHGSDVHASVNLHATRFKDALHFRPQSLPKYPEALLSLRYLSAPEAGDKAAWTRAYLKGRIAARKVDYTPDGYFDGVEASFRTLKQLMEDRRDRVREGDFFNLELRARRRRSDVPLWERIASLFYWLISDYGNSIFRPLVVMALLFAGLAGAYYILGEAHGAQGQGSHLLSAFGFSLQNVFAPFSALDAGKFSAKDTWVNGLVFSSDPGFSLTIKAIASLQSLLTLSLAFLAGLAGRRRFQIN